MLLAVVRRARALRGEVVAELAGSKPERFTPGLQVFLHRPGEPEDSNTDAVVESSWMHAGQLVLKFRGIDDRTSAEQLHGMEVRIPIEERPELPEGEYYLSDLVGCRVETTEGRVIGEVHGHQDHGAAPLLEVRSGGKEMLVPFVQGVYKEVDLTGRRIVVDLPEGLEDL